MAHSTVPQLFSTTGRPETLTRGNRCDCTLTEPALHVQPALSCAARRGGRLLLGAGAAASTASESGRQRKRVAGVAGRMKIPCVLPILSWASHDNFSPWRRAC
jgi:hypothetical protein